MLPIPKILLGIAAIGITGISGTFAIKRLKSKDGTTTNSSDGEQKSVTADETSGPTGVAEASVPGG